MSRTTHSINRIKHDLDRISGFNSIVVSNELEELADKIHEMVEEILTSSCEALHAKSVDTICGN